MHDYYAQPIYYTDVSKWCESLVDWSIPLSKSRWNLSLLRSVRPMQFCRHITFISSLIHRTSPGHVILYTGLPITCINITHARTNACIPNRWSNKETCFTSDVICHGYIMLVSDLKVFQVTCRPRDDLLVHFEQLPLPAPAVDDGLGRLLPLGSVVGDCKEKLQVKCCVAVSCQAHLVRGHSMYTEHHKDRVHKQSSSCRTLFV